MNYLSYSTDYNTDDIDVYFKLFCKEHLGKIFRVHFHPDNEVWLGKKYKIYDYKYLGATTSDLRLDYSERFSHGAFVMLGDCTLINEAQFLLTWVFGSEIYYSKLRIENPAHEINPKGDGYLLSYFYNSFIPPDLYEKPIEAEDTSGLC